jgi:hypothetical protein
MPRVRSKFAFQDSDAWPVAAALIHAYEAGDEEKLAGALKDNQLKYLNTQVSQGEQAACTSRIPCRPVAAWAHCVRGLRVASC